MSQINYAWYGHDGSQYEARVASEIEIYRNCTEVHALPPIFHYWSNRYIRPQLEARGFSNPAEMFLRIFERQCAKYSGERVKFLSVGSGNCDLEIELAVRLRALGYQNFVIECLDLNSAMLERGGAAAATKEVAGNLEFTEADFNLWTARHEYHGVMADQSLHHVVELERLFGQIRQALCPNGVFVMSDMIGRNGHRRWPEALTIVQEFWQKLPPSYRYNHQSGRYQAVFEDVDCSTESFEGIRAQDILPLLKEYFHFQFFLGFSNITDPFVDRGFGPNFDPASDWDREFIDRLHQRDEQEIAAGNLQPTHMLAVVGKDAAAPPLFGAFVVPRTRVPVAEDDIVPNKPFKGDYEWGSWPHSPSTQLETVCAIAEAAECRTALLETRLNKAIGDERQLRFEFEERSAWALQLDGQLKAGGLAGHSQEEIAGLIEWARGLDAELAEQTAWALALDNELQGLRQLERERTQVYENRMHRRLRRYLRTPLKYAGVVVSSITNRA